MNRAWREGLPALARELAAAWELTLGDPAYDSVQHMLNCDERLAGDPVGMPRRTASLLDLEPERVVRSETF